MPPGEGVLEVNGLRLVDDAGRARVTLWADGDEAGVSWFDSAGTQRARLLAGDKESILTFFDETGEERTVLTQGFNDHGLYLQGADGHDRAALVALDDGRDLGLHLSREGDERVGLVATQADEGLFFRGDRGLFVVREDEAESLQLVTDR